MQTNQSIEFPKPQPTYQIPLWIPASSETNQPKFAEHPSMSFHLQENNWNINILLQEIQRKPQSK